MMNALSSIDKANNWIFSTDYSTFERWIKPNYEVNCTNANGVWSVVSTKNGRRKTVFCGTQLNNSGKNSLTYKCLSTNW